MLWPLLIACQPAPLGDLPEGTIAFAGVDLLSMVDDGLTPDRHVLVHDGRVLEVVDGALALPESVSVIDGAGRVLMPGLIDMHVHHWFEGEQILFVANGVTTVRNLFGDPVHLAWREAIAAGEQLGPRIVTSGPIIDGYPPIWPGSDTVTSREEAAEVVQAQAAAGYDLAKVYALLGKPGWNAVLDEADAIGLPAVGHTPWSVDLPAAHESTQRTVEHLDGFLEAAAGSAERLSLYDPDAVSAALAQVDEERVLELAEQARESGTWHCPTLTVFRRIAPPELTVTWSEDPKMRYVHPAVLESWKSGAVLSDEAYAAIVEMTDAFEGFVGALDQVGAGVLLGTDATNPWVVHGFSVHEELEHLVASGLTAESALRAGTVTAAAALGREGELGVVAAGALADLVLLEANPLEDVANAQERAGVMLAGTWWTEAELQGELDRLAEVYEAGRAGEAPVPPMTRHRCVR